jgi:putative tryptophan/tyrosine transport system substrate-binding protein
MPGSLGRTSRRQSRETRVSRMKRESRRKLMKKRIIGFALSAVVFAFYVSAEAQQQAKIAKIGYLFFRSASDPAAGGRRSFERELRALGYVEGKNIAIEDRSAEGKIDRLPVAAGDLVHLKVDVIVTASTVAALAAKNATRTIPIVFFSAGDPVATGLVDSLARPGGNITGFTDINPVLAGKRLELLKETIPSSPALRCYGIHRVPPKNGKKVNCRREN